MRSIFDPTGQTLLARRCSGPCAPQSVEDDIKEFLAILRDEEGGPGQVTDAAARERFSLELGGRSGLARLRIAAVVCSFLSAVSSLGLCAFAFVSHAEWPLFAVCTVSSGATVMIAAFLAALRRWLNRQTTQLRMIRQVEAALQDMAERKIADLETRQILRISQDDPELAKAILVGIVSEYADAEKASGQGGEMDGSGTFSRFVDVTAKGDSNHLIARTLHRLVADVGGAH
ncbi:hypothetical protein [Streptomyces caatingaensis]|uniref:Uncharacterized protein n=1 Tax=Streptomyces caatingaensis TaxID=1678637 RepID=A0A0K9XFS9_9ACTN|nr:hypothetical protein [Streptomyces caatingaensis]KNB51532.1 hypothetical protein AC230_14210 [Streptomyces caatingaensis]